jgi:hypothetical protein
MDLDDREIAAPAGGAGDAAGRGAAAARPASRGARLARAASIGLLAAAVQFVLLTALAMALYPGGSAHDPAARGYSFTHNFFSDLGATATESGAANPVDHAIFTYALVCIGVTLAGFGFAVRSLAADWGSRSGSGERGGRARRAVAALAPAAATIGGIGFVAVGLIPEDVSGTWHKQCVNLAFGMLFVFVLCLLTLELKGGWGLPLTVPNSVYVVLLGVYVYLLFWGPSTATVRGLVIQVVAQKVIVYASILNLGWQALGFVRGLRTA